MWFPSFLLLLACTSVLADLESDLKTCTDQIDLVELENMISMKSREELGVICPMFTNFFTCIEDIVKSHIGLSLAQVADLTAGTEIGKGAALIVNTKNLIEEVCTEGTPLNTDYMADIDCFDRIENPMDKCKEEAEEAYEVFGNFVESVEEGAGEDDIQADRDCMTLAYQSACVASVIHDTCGRRAFNTYNTMVKRTAVFKIAICSPQGLENLKSTFVDNLEMEEAKKDLYRLAFDLRKRRK